MSGLLPTLGRAVPVASSSRAFATSALALAKPPTKPAMKKRQGMTKKKGGPAGPVGRVKVHGLKLATELGKPAADLTDLVQLYPESVIGANAGKAAVIPRKTYDALRELGLPARVEGDLAQGAPASVIRRATVDLVAALEAAKAGASADARMVLTGARGAGKSMLLVQAVAYALEAGWVVLYTPRASRWVDSSSQFAYNADTLAFEQPEAAGEMLAKLLAVNKDKLAQITLPADVKLADGTVPAGESLVKLLEHGLREDSKVTVATLDAALGILGEQEQFPVLFAVDEAQALFRTSAYRRPDYERLEAYHLSMPRMALEFLSGARGFKRGAVLGALAQSQTEYMPSTPLIAGLGLPSRTPIHAYTPVDETYLAYAKSGIRNVEVPFGMSGPEAAAMFELFTRKGWTSNSSDDVFMGGFTAAAGNPTEMSRSWLVSHQAFIA